MRDSPLFLFRQSGHIRSPAFFGDSEPSAAAGAVENEEKQNDDNDPEELFVFKNIAEASHDMIPFYFHLGFSSENGFPRQPQSSRLASSAALIP